MIEFAWQATAQGLAAEGLNRVNAVGLRLIHRFNKAKPTKRVGLEAEFDITRACEGAGRHVENNAERDQRPEPSEKRLHGIHAYGNSRYIRTTDMICSGNGRPRGNLCIGL